MSVVPIPHPAKGLLAARRISVSAIAREYGCSSHFAGRVLNGWTRPPRRFRAFLSQRLGRPEADLFHADALVALPRHPSLEDGVRAAIAEAEEHKRSERAASLAADAK